MAKKSDQKTIVPVKPKKERAVFVFRRGEMDIANVAGASTDDARVQGL
jgi:hypothetical protein